MALVLISTVYWETPSSMRPAVKVVSAAVVNSKVLPFGPEGGPTLSGVGAVAPANVTVAV